MSADEEPAPSGDVEGPESLGGQKGLEGQKGQEGLEEGEEEGEHPRFAPFEMLCLGLAAQAQVALGFFPDPVTHETKKQLPAAREAIDLLAVLEEKTKGNLTTQESALLGGLLTDLRLAFVRAAK